MIAKQEQMANKHMHMARQSPVANLPAYLMERLLETLT